MKTKTFLIKSINSVFIDNYEEGEGDMVNEYNIKGEISAESAESALMLFVENNLLFNYDKENLQVDDLCGAVYSTLVNNKNQEATERDITEWRKGEVKLYSHYSKIEVFELVKVDIITNL